MKDLLHGSLREHVKTFGVDMLTGEAEGIRGMGRILCDLTEKGKALWEKFLGSQVEFREHSNWNPGEKDDPAVASVMATMALLSEFLVFAWADRGCIVYDGVLVKEPKGAYREQDARSVWENDDELAGWLAESEYNQMMWDDYSWRKIHKEGTAGTRNTNVMSGRVT